jgi:hypothetical protein
MGGLYVQFVCDGFFGGRNALFNTTESLDSDSDLDGRATLPQEFNVLQFLDLRSIADWLGAHFLFPLAKKEEFLSSISSTLI